MTKTLGQWLVPIRVLLIWGGAFRRSFFCIIRTYHKILFHWLRLQPTDGRSTWRKRQTLTTIEHHVIGMTRSPYRCRKTNHDRESRVDNFRCPTTIVCTNNRIIRRVLEVDVGAISSWTTDWFARWKIHENRGILNWDYYFELRRRCDFGRLCPRVMQNLVPPLVEWHRAIQIQQEM